MKIKVYNQTINLKSGYGKIRRFVLEILKSKGYKIVSSGKADITFWIDPPYCLKRGTFNPKEKNIIFTMHEREFFEEKKKGWISLLNKCSAVIVPTEWNKKVFIRHGLRQPIYVAPLGIDYKLYHGAKSYQFSILTLHDALGRDSSRENWKDTLLAFCLAFKDRGWADTELIIKSYNINWTGYKGYLAELEKRLGSEFIKNIQVVEVDMDEKTLNNFYARHWLFVKNANREGWSLPLMEAMSCGLDIAHTDLPVLKWTEGYPKRFIFPLGDTKKLAEIFQDRFKHWKREKGFITKFSWRKIVERIENVFKET